LRQFQVYATGLLGWKIRGAFLPVWLLDAQKEQVPESPLYGDLVRTL
jgi:hypothetical protein